MQLQARVLQELLLLHAHLIIRMIVYGASSTFAGMGNDAILNFSKRSRVPGVHPADSEIVDPGLPKSIKKNFA